MFNLKNLAFALLWILAAQFCFSAPVKVSEIKNGGLALMDENETVFVDALKEPFKLEGFPWYNPADAKPLYRIPRTFTIKDVSEGVLYHANHLAGGAVRFSTNSKFLYIRALIRAGSDMWHMPRTGSAGFDVFIDSPQDGYPHLKTVRMTPDAVYGKKIVEEKLCVNAEGKMRNYVIWLPLYSGLEYMQIGLDKNADLDAPREHKIKKPILFYGSSITQGACASKPANAYTTMLCMAVDAPQINLGFSGNALGHIALAKAIASLDLAAFVYDYDYNAPNAKHLLDTHEKFFLEIRKTHPNLPVIMLTRCSMRQADRRDAVKRTYENAVKRGDKNVYFIDGAELFGEAGDLRCTVEDTHPNDLGFFMMYKRILPVLRESLSKSAQ